MGGEVMNWKQTRSDGLGNESMTDAPERFVIFTQFNPPLQYRFNCSPVHLLFFISDFKNPCHSLIEFHSTYLIVLLMSEDVCPICMKYESVVAVPAGHIALH